MKSPKRDMRHSLTESIHSNEQDNGFSRGRRKLWNGPDQNPMEAVWGDLKRAVHRRCPRNLTHLERFCKEEWGNISMSRFAMLIYSCPKRLSALIKPRGARGADGDAPSPNCLPQHFMKYF